jgi:glycosyltransferase involved in cell wall biosynthesis
MNFQETFRLSGGANSFLSSLRLHLKKRGFQFTNDPTTGFDLALLNALTDGLTLEKIKEIHSYGKPIIHRKVGYRVSGPPELRFQKNGIVQGDLLQIEMSPYVHHTIFQSQYSYNNFINQGFKGDYSIILNGVDTENFNPYGKRKIINSLFQNNKNSYPKWCKNQSFRLAIVTWSKDKNKGFDKYIEFDRALNEQSNLEIWFIGRYPSDVRFKNIKVFKPCNHKKLGNMLRSCHGFIQMAQHETCSNALLEAINCGLPVIYLDSGSNKEIAENYGVKYVGDPRSSINKLQENYEQYSKKVRFNPYSIEHSAIAYVDIFRKLML